MPHVLLIDNYDSFTWNLAQYLGELGAKVVVHRNDAITLADAERIDPSHIVISPGPGHPKDARVSLDLIRAFTGRRPILGVCLGHQAIGLVHGAEVRRAGRIMHGKTSPIRHDQKGVFRSLPDPLLATRYHSLLLHPDNLPATLEVSARTDEGEIMGLRVKGAAVEGVQFHPESILSEAGHRLLRNFLEL